MVVRFGTRVQALEFLSMPNFVKTTYGDIPLWGKFIPKMTNFGDFGTCKPTFLKPQP